MIILQSDLPLLTTTTRLCTTRASPDHARSRTRPPSVTRSTTLKTPVGIAPVPCPHPRSRSHHRLSRGRSRDRCATTCHPGHPVGRPPPRPTWVLRVPTLIFLTLSVIFLLLMSLPLYRTIVPRPHLVPDRRPCICGPVPHSGCNPLSFHADSCPSSLLSGPLSQCHTRPSDSVLLSSIDSSSAEWWFSGLIIISLFPSLITLWKLLQTILLTSRNI